MAQGLLSKGIKLSYKKASSYTELLDLQEIPELGGSSEKVEVTTLLDGAKRYINGIKDYGDLAFKFLYDNSSSTSSYRVLQGLEVSEAITEFKVELPDGTTFEFNAQVSTVLDGVGVNSPLTFTANLSLNSEMTVSHPAAG